eukprot:13566883-Alexandrium_andersonii.AAC.1
MVFQGNVPLFLPSRWTKVFHTPAYFAPAFLLGSIGNRGFRTAFSQAVAQAEADVGAEQQNPDPEDDFKVVQSK